MQSRLSVRMMHDRRPQAKGDGPSRSRGPRSCARVPWMSLHRRYGACRQELASDGIEIRQCKHDVRARQVFREPAIADLREAPQPLHHKEGMFAASPRARAGAIDLPPPFAQRVVPAPGAPIDAVADSTRLVRVPIGLLPVGLVAVEDLL